MSETFTGFRTAPDGLSQYNVLQFMMQQMLDNKVCTAIPAKVLKVIPGEGLLAGTVEIQPMVNQITADNSPITHGTIFNVPYVRSQGGKNAIIIDPVVGDFGIAIFAMRDISLVKKNKRVDNPGSFRRLDYADAMYIGGMLNAVPQQYIQFLNDGNGNPNGITIHDKFTNEIVMDTDGIKINGVLFNRTADISAARKIDATGEITAKSGTGSAVHVTTHTHGGVQTGGGTSGAPTPGS